MSGICFSTLLLWQKGGGPFPHLSTTQPMKDLKLDQWKATILQTPICLQWTLCLQQLLWTPSFLYKRRFLSFALWTWHGLPWDCMCPTAILWCSQINPFCWRNIWLSIYLKSTIDLAFCPAKRWVGSKGKALTAIFYKQTPVIFQIMLSWPTKKEISLT